MTKQEFLSFIKSRGATFTPPATQTEITLASANLQGIRAAMLPAFLVDLYNSCSGIILGSAYIFGPKQIERDIKYPVPSILDINKDVSGNKNLFGKTVFGRNDLFWFAVDALGNCVMLDNLTLSVMRKYDDPYRAMIDCLVVGKI